jgi:hypothetical protein
MVFDLKLSEEDYIKNLYKELVDELCEERTFIK